MVARMDVSARLVRLVFPEHRQEGDWAALIAAVVVYVTQAFFYFRTRTTRSGLIMAGVLVAILICNVAGCRTMIHGH